MRNAIQVRSKPTPAGALVELDDLCSRVTALAKPDDVGAFAMGNNLMGALSGMGGGGVSDSDTRYLYPKTALFWEDGKPAGEARESRQYDLWHQHPTRPELACIVHDLIQPSDTISPNEPPDRAPAHARLPTELTLCFRYADTNYRR
jgi:hypothetical protein